MMRLLGSSGIKFVLEKEFSNGIYLLTCNSTEPEKQIKILQNSKQFIKHLFRVERVLKGSEDLEKDLTVLKEYIDTKNLEINDSFSVQVRNINNGNYTAKDLEVGLGRYIETKFSANPYFNDKEIPPDINQKIVSVLIFGKELYIGIGSVSENLYSVSDPYRIFSRWKTHISRAEFKLREALQILHYEPKKGGLAVDLGAAPGGWSLVLAEYGINVIAVDPAKLDDKLLDVKNITHFRGKSQDFHTDKKIDLLVNDMNMEPRDSANIVMSFSKNLEIGTLLIMTIKLVGGPFEKRIQEVCETLDDEFKLLDVRLLFHNRQEVTAFFEKR